MIRSGHLCSGYDGLGMALTLAGLDHAPAWHFENEPDASHVLKMHDPTCPNYGDLTAAPPAGWLPAVDVLTAGFPCQPVSEQGLKRGRADRRWLWPHVRAAYRGGAMPFRILLENVGNLVTIEGGALHDGILGDLRADGYAVKWGVYGACEVGAAHHRHRWFALADHVGDLAPVARRVRGMRCGFPRSMGRLLPTPRAGDERRGVEPDRAARTGTGPTLNDAVGTLPERSWGIYEAAIRRHEATMGNPAPRPVDSAGRLTGAFAEWLMMLPYGHISARGLSRASVVRLAGNGVVPDQARFAYQGLERG